jgi:hypothetical protein
MGNCLNRDINNDTSIPMTDKKKYYKGQLLDTFSERIFAAPYIELNERKKEFIDAHIDNFIDNYKTPIGKAFFPLSKPYRDNFKTYENNLILSWYLERKYPIFIITDAIRIAHEWTIKNGFLLKSLGLLKSFLPGIINQNKYLQSYFAVGGRRLTEESELKAESDPFFFLDWLYIREENPKNIYFDFFRGAIL